MFGVRLKCTKLSGFSLVITRSPLPPELEMILATDVKNDPEDEEVIETEYKEENTAEHIDSKKDDQKLNALKEKIMRLKRKVLLWRKFLQLLEAWCWLTGRR